MSLNSKIQTLRQLAGYVGCCENWNNALPCQKICDKQYIPVDELKKEIKASIKRLEQADRTAYGKAVLVELLQSLSQIKSSEEKKP